MAFSLSNWFKGKPGAPGSENPGENPTPESDPAPVAVAPAPPVAAPAAVRKVMPNSVQPVSLRTPGSVRPVALPVSAPTPHADRVSPTVSAPRPKISFGGPDHGSPGAATAPEPPAAIADAVVSLEVGDFLDRLPPSFVQPGHVDRQRRVDFRASELYSDLTKGRASVPASVIYQKCPELFSRPVTEEEDTEVALPLQKLVEQMSQAFQTRTDQVAEENVGEIETPFLQVAMEDSARLPKAQGTTAGALRSAAPLAPAHSPLDETPRRPHRTGQISTISPLKPAPEPPPMQSAPSAATVAPINPAKRPPSTVRASVAGGKIRLSGPAMPNRMVPVNVPPPAGVVPTAEAPAAPAPELPPSASQRILPPLQVPGGPMASPSLQVSKKTARIQIPPISLRGAGSAARPAAPSAVSVQPSPVPVRPGPSAEPAVPPIAFRSTPPPPGTKKMPHTFAPPPPRPVVPPPAFPAIAPLAAAVPAAMGSIPSGFPAATDDRKISLSLAAVLRGLPLSSLTVEPNSVPDDVRVTLPFSLVEPQLAQGRVSIPHAVFAGSLPESHREVLASNSGLSEIPLPLQEVFQNLPSAALAIRQDQVVEEIGNAYPTPFSQKAEEDAQRLGTPVKDAAPEASAAAPAPEDTVIPPPEIAMDRPLPADPVAEVDAPEIIAAAPAAPAVPEPVAEGEDEAPSEEFANLFVEEPAAPARDIPLDFGGDKSVATEEPTAPEPVVEAKAPAPETTPDAAPEQKAADVIPELKLESAPEVKVEAPAPETKPEAHAEEKPAIETAPPAEAVPPGFAVEAKHEEPAVPSEHQTPAAKAPEPVPAAPEPAARQEEPKMAEPARELETAPVPVVRQTEQPPEVSVPARKTAPVPVHDSTLQSLFMTEDELDAKGVVRHVCALPGVEGCSVMFEDGLQLAGNFPDEADVEGFSAMAPPFFKRTRNFAGETHLGSLRAFTLYTDSGLYSFFMHDHICLSVRHAGRGFLPGVREKLEVVTRELARMYTSV